MTELYNPFTGETSDVSKKFNFGRAKEIGGQVISRAKTESLGTSARRAKVFGQDTGRQAQGAFQATQRNAAAAGKTTPRHMLDTGLERYGTGRVVAGVGGAGLAGGYALHKSEVSKDWRTGGQKVGRKVAEGWKRVTEEGDATLGALGVKSKTAAYTIGGGVGLASGNNAARMRAQRAREKREAVGKAVSPMFGAKDAFANQPTRKIGMLLPTGSHVSHANKLSHTKGKRVGSVPKGRSQALTHIKKNDDLSRQPGMINPGVVTSSWSHGTPNQNFSASQGRRGRKIS